MKAFLRENPTIAFGLGLPLLLVVAFLLASGIPALFVAPPVHDVLYATDYYNYSSGVQISVVNRRVQVVYQGTVQSYPQPRLWRYNAKTGAVQEIAIVPPPGLTPPGQLPNDAATLKVTPIDVPDLANLTVDPSSIAPDGYEFRAGPSDYSRDIFTGLFAGYRYRNDAVLVKSGRSVRLPNVAGNYYGNYTRLIGWVVSP